MELTLASILSVRVAGGRLQWDAREFLLLCSSADLFSNLLRILLAHPTMGIPMSYNDPGRNDDTLQST